jgi:hypothetical protein
MVTRTLTVEPKMYRTEGRTVVATVEGQEYRIPDMWLVGATHGGRTVAEAVQLWHEQAVMEQEFQAQQ